MQIIYIIILMIAITEACGQYCLKSGKLNKNTNLYFIGFLCYLLVGYLLLKSYKYKGLGFCNLIWSALSILLACISGKIFFGEKINYLACILVISAVYVINMDSQ